MSAPAITITGNLQSIFGTTDGGSVTFTLSNYSPNIPRVSGTSILDQVSQTLSGTSFSTLLYGNDVISPGPNITFYTVTFVSSTGHKFSANYQFTGSGTLDISNLTPMNSSVPASPTPSAVLTNPTGTQTVVQPTGTKLAINNLENIRFADQFASLQAAHDDLPTAGGTIFVPSGSTPFGAGSTALTITKSCHIIFDIGTFTYTGITAAITVSGTRAVIIEGASESGDGNVDGGTTIVITNTATNGIVCSNSPGVQLKNFNLTGPGSGSGKGIITSSTRGLFKELVIRAFGSDGWTTDGTATNANEGIIEKVRSLSNGGVGFKLQGNNQQGYTLIGADAALNTGDQYSIANGLNNFQGTNASPGSPGIICYHFISGANNNYGYVFADAPSPTITYDSGATDNSITSLGGFGGGNGISTGNTIVVDNGARNFTYGSNLSNGSTIGAQFTCLSGTSGSPLSFPRFQTTATGRVGFEFALGGVDYWRLEGADGGNNNAFMIREESTSPLIHFLAAPNGITEINSTGTQAVQINVRSTSGTTTGTQFGDGVGNVKASIDSSGRITVVETSAPAGVASNDQLWPDSTAHRWKMNNNNVGADAVVGAATTDTLTGKTYDTAGSGNVLKVGGATIPSGAPAANQTLIASSGTVVGWKNLSRRLDYQTGTGAITLDGTDKTIYTTTLTGGLLNGNTVRGHAIFQHTGGSGSVSYKVFYGSQSLAILTLNTTINIIELNFEISGTGNSNQDITVGALIAGTAILINPQTNVYTVDSTASQVIKLTANGAGTEAVTGSSWKLFYEAS